MKKVHLFTCVVLLSTIVVRADLISITASGSITNTENSSFSIGTLVEYVFEFDTDQDGYFVMGNQSYIINDRSGMDYFYAAYQGDFNLPDYNIQDMTVYYYGLELANGFTSLYGRSGSRGVQISAQSGISTWQVGTVLSGNEYSAISTSANGTVFERAYSDLIITRISRVPEPSVFVLLISSAGVLGGGFFRFQRRRKREKRPNFQ